ncbi:DNA damage-binding protein 1a [Gryganskiella cystojenkinii]|nr:DNA damage-binding protein 1a [Gryganskiella cystojenkinii]
MNIVFTARKSSAVFQAIKGNFTGPEDLNLILGKGTRVEVYLVGRDGLKMVKEFGIYGEIACMEAFRPPGHYTDMLMLTTIQYQMLTLSLNLATTDDSTTSAQFGITSDSLLDLRDRHARPADDGQIVIIDPTSSIVCCHLYQGLLKCITVNPHAPRPNDPSPGSNGGSRNILHALKSRPAEKTFLDQFSLPIDEVTIMSMCFLYGTSRPTLAVLHQDKKEVRHVKTYEFDLKTKDKYETGWVQSGLTGAKTCVAVPTPIGGLLVIGEYSISYFNPAHPTEPRSIAINSSILQCHERVDDRGDRYLLGDHTGMLHILVLITQPASSPSQAVRVTDLKFECLGTTSIPEAIVYLDNNHVYVGSHLGDSQLVLLHTDADENGEFIEVAETFVNIAPITDFDVVDLEGQGQGQIVACSGAFKDGSLRIVRSGVGINDRAVLDLPGIKGLWSLKDDLESKIENILVMSFLDSTRVVSVTADSDMIQEELEGFLTNSSTMLCGNVQGGLYLQVCPKSVRLIAPLHHIQSGLIAEWTPSEGQHISIASMNGTQCLLSVGGKTLVCLDVGSESIKEVGRTTFENEIACIDASAIVAESPYSSQICAVGLWTDIKVVLVRLPTMEILASHDLPGEILPRSLLLARFEGIPYLLAGLGDGQLLTFTLDSSLTTLPTPKRISLGTQPILLRPIAAGLNTGSSCNVFACSDRPTVIYSSNRKLVYSNVNLGQVATVASFNCDAYPNALAIVGSDEAAVLKIGSIDEFQELHVQTFPILESPRRIAYLAPRKCFGVLSIGLVNEDIPVGNVNLPDNEEEVGYLRLHDDQTFDLLTSYKLLPGEAPQSITAVTFAGDSTRYIAIGTADEVEQEDKADDSLPSKGRILVFEVTENSQLQLTAVTEVKGGVMSIKEFNGKLLCGINEHICLYSWKPENVATDTKLAVECTHRGFIFLLSLAVQGEFIIAADLMKSMTLLRYKSTENKIEEIARDPSMDMLTTLEAIDDETFIGANVHGSLYTLIKNTDPTNEDAGKQLQWSGGWNLGDPVNRIKHGTLVMANHDGDAPAVPKLLFATVSGAIGVIATLTLERYELLHQLEVNMSKVIKGVGGLDHAS